ncbi:MAG: BamA/TamA family outer membrane protein [Bdellovibrionaceae bacterium]|nr:BamA/TamA family outer membrane protein [Pseudobdellovibrionaceae bacterium]
MKTQNPDVYKIVQDSLKKLNTNDSNEIKQRVMVALRKERYLTSRIDIHLTDKTVYVTDEQKYLVLFNGNTSISDTKIKEAFNLSELNSTSYSIQEDLRGLILRLYAEMGFNKTEVTYEKKYFQQDRLIRLTYNIQEGTYSKLGKITILGSYSRPQKYYVQFIKNRSSALIKKGGFSSKDFENGINNLVTDLKNQGYLEASVSGVKVSEDPIKPNVLNLSFELHEGVPIRIYSINFIGNKDIDSEWLEVLLGLKQNDVINFYKFEEGLQTIIDYYISTGYLKAELNPGKKNLVQIDYEQRLASIDIEIQEGPKIIVGDIQIKGNEKTSDFLIQKSLGFEVGDVLTASKLQTARQRLGLLSLFSRADIQFIKQVDRPGHLVSIDVEERKPGLVQVGFGVNNQRELTIKAYTGVLYRNLWGTGRAINSRLELQSSFLESDFIEYRSFVSFFEPFLFGSNFSGRMTVDSSKNIFNIEDTPTRKQTTIFSSSGFDFVVENQVNSHIKATWTILGFDYIKFYHIKHAGSGFSDDVREQIGSFGPAVDIDYRNNPVLPTKGFFSRLEGEFAPSLLGTRVESNAASSKNSFVRMQASYTRYDDLNEHLVWVNTVRGGYLRNLSRDTDFFPQSRAFFLGGANTIRGFDPSKQYERIPSNYDLQGQIIGGYQGGGLLTIPTDSYYYLFKTEMRVPLYKQLWGSVFYDGGAVLIDGVNFNDAYRDAAGVGVRFNTPVGALSVDLGFKLDRKKYLGESPARLHISIGTF